MFEVRSSMFDVRIFSSLASRIRPSSSSVRCSKFDVRRSTFAFSLLWPHVSAPLPLRFDVRSSKFDVRRSHFLFSGLTYPPLFLFGSMFEVRSSMFDVRIFSSLASRLRSLSLSPVPCPLSSVLIRIESHSTGTFPQLSFLAQDALGDTLEAYAPPPTTDNSSSPVSFPHICPGSGSGDGWKGFDSRCSTARIRRR